jgi:hypothetical protein
LPIRCTGDYFNKKLDDYKQFVQFEGAVMKTRLLISLAMLAGLNLSAGLAIANEEPPVKMSKTGICHARGTSYYAQTRNYTAYNTLEECLQAGGRKPKR